MRPVRSRSPPGSTRPQPASTPTASTPMAPVEVNLNAAATITTSWTGAYGLYASDGGAIDAEDAPSIATHGTGAIGVYASGAGSSIAVGGGATIATAGASAAGLQADAGGLVTLNGGSVTTTGIGAPGLCRRRRFEDHGLERRRCDEWRLRPEHGKFLLRNRWSNAGSATVSGGSITTNGPVAHGVFAFNGGSVALSARTTVPRRVGDRSACL